MAEVHDQRANAQQPPAGAKPDTKVGDAKLPQTKAGAEARADVPAGRVVQSTFNEHMRAGVPGMINRMVDYNAVTRSAEAIPVPACRAVSQSLDSDIGAVLGGPQAQFVGITILDPTLVYPVTAGAYSPDTYPPYTNMGVLTKGEMFAIADVPTTAGDPLYYEAATGILKNLAGIGPVPGGRWKYTRQPGELNVVQLGIQT